jgi:hypothetical protein
MMVFEGGEGSVEVITYLLDDRGLTFVRKRTICVSENLVQCQQPVVNVGR